MGNKHGLIKGEANKLVNINQLSQLSQLTDSNGQHIDLVSGLAGRLLSRRLMARIGPALPAGVLSAQPNF